MHLETEQVQRLLHGELERSVEAALRRHLAECADCRRLLDEAGREEEEILRLLRRLDHAVPAVRAETLVVRGRTRIWGRRAAGVLLALTAAGALYAAPGSPLPALADRLVRWIAGRAESQAPSPDTGPAGIAVQPSERFVIAFAGPQSRGVAAVSLTADATIVARRLGGAATFTTDVDRLVIDNAGSTSDYEIELPRAAQWVEIRVGPRRALLKDGARVHTEAPIDSLGRFLVALTPPER